MKEWSENLKCKTQSGWLNLTVVSEHPASQPTTSTAAMMMTACGEDTVIPSVY